MSDAGPLAPYDAVLLLSYGGPDGPESVEPFLHNVMGGRSLPPERAAEVVRHYARFGGVSPINARNAELAEALTTALADQGADVPVVVGNRNWRPFIADALRTLAEGGAQRVLYLTTSAYASYTGCRQYREALAAAQAETGVMLEFAKIGAYAQRPGFVQANAEALADAAGSLPGAEVRVLFVTHSIPEAMDATSGPGAPSLRYAARHRAVAAQVSAAAAVAGSRTVDWELVFCSRSGRPDVPWLGPDLEARLAQLPAEGVTDVVLAPIGFVNDHMEVVYDLDVAAREVAQAAGLRVIRAATAGIHPAFIADLAESLLHRAAVARGEAVEQPEDRLWCGPSCCLSGRPDPGAPAPGSGARRPVRA